MYVGLGDVLSTTNRLEEAVDAYHGALRHKPASADIYYRLGLLYGGHEQTGPARSAFQAAATLSPTSVESLHALGICMSLEHAWPEAERQLSRVFQLRPVHESVRFDLAVARQQLKRPQEALMHYDACLVTCASSVPREQVFTNRASALVDLGRVAEGLSSYGKALAIAPRFPEVYANLAVMHNGRQQPAVALEALRVGRELAPTYPQMHLNLGLTLKQTFQHHESTYAFGEALRLAPQSTEALCHLAFSHKRLSIWKGWEVLIRDAHDTWRAGHGGQAWDPLYGLALPLRSPVVRALAVARAARVVLDAANQVQRPTRPLWPRVDPAAGLQTLRVAYLSADFGPTAVGGTIRSFFRRHARQPDGSFDVFAFSLRADDESEYHRSVLSGVDEALASFQVVSDVWASTRLPGGRAVRERVERLGEERASHRTNRRYVDLSAAEDLHVAYGAIAAAQPHILIDLNGYTDGERTELLALRPAPVAMHAIGFPATMGADFAPYILLDRQVALPAPHVRRAITERLVLLPNCYLINSHHDVFGAGRLGPDATRPQQAREKALLINFNQLYKLEPRTLELWCGLLHRSAGRAVLWLRRQPEESAPAIFKEFAACGSQGARLIFADYVFDERQHMHRIAHAQLSLDTPEYNGHTTGNDMLWAAVPSLTAPAEHLTARMGRSLLAAAGSSSGEVQSLRAYQDLATALSVSSEQGRVLVPSRGGEPPALGRTPASAKRSRRRVRAREFPAVAAAVL